MDTIDKVGLIGLIICSILFSMIGISELIQGYIGGIVFLLAGIALLILVLKEIFDKNKAVEWMKCVICHRKADFVYKGYSYCEKHYREKKGE